jgi:hypothetical protein
MTDNNPLMRRINLSRGLSEVGQVSTPVMENADEVGAMAAYGWLRGVKDRAQMLELRMLSGSFRSLAYAWLFDVKFDPSLGIEMDFGSVKVKLEGRNLRPLHELIQRHRAVWVQCLDPKRDVVEEGATVVTAISVRENIKLSRGDGS